jgi:hypothetical protein
MSDQPANPNTEPDEWLRLLKTSGDELHTEEGPASLAVLVEAMRQTGDALTPSEETRRATWQQIEHSMAKRSQPAQSGNSFFSRRFWGMPAYATALMASGAALVIGLLVLDMQTKDADITVVAMRGGVSRIPVEDFSAPQPKLVQELRDMELEVESQREAAQILLTIPVPDPPSPALLAWAARWGVTPMPGSKWQIVLVPASQENHE